MHQEIDFQQKVTNLCVKTAILLLENGAESTLIAELAHRLGFTLGMEQVECALSPNAIIVTTSYKNHSLTIAKKTSLQHIDMEIVTQIQHIIIKAERKKCSLQTNLNIVSRRFDSLKYSRYNPYLVSFMVALSCASFSYLAGGDAIIFAITFIASLIGILAKNFFSKKQYNYIIVFALTALLTSLISGLAQKYNLGNHPQIALASSVLLLVPGFPLINSLADILKGHVGMGLSRWARASVLTFGTCLGIVFALNILKLTNWGG